ncbi:MAG: GDSL-type esterase/lipase family protein [Kiritimatiellaeota bacterium]|nr:GDSL-type esterase/lipase family protein [Kiritimatiellota bacterium]
MKSFQVICVLLALWLGACDRVPHPAETGDSKLTTGPLPVLLKPDGQQFTLVKNWIFGNQRPEATVRDKAGLDQEFFYRYIWENGKLDKFKTYWSFHRDYPEGDSKSLHVFSANALTLKARIPPGGGLRERGIESGLLRAKLPVTPGMYIEMRAKLPGGVGVWPNFWLEQGVQSADGTISQPAKAMSEIDIFEFFNWDGRPETRIMTCNTHAWGGDKAHGNPHDIYTTLKNVGFEKHLDVGCDCSKDFHIFALDWVKDKPVWLFDGKPIKQTYYEWTEPAAHVVVANSIGMNLPGVKQTQMVADEKQWDYVIDYIRIWNHTAGALPIPVSPPGSSAPTTIAPAAKPGGPLTLATTGKWQSPVISASTADVAKLKVNPLLKVDITVPPDADDAGWFMVKLAINGPGIARTESPQWLLDRRPGKAGIDKFTLAWDASKIVAKLPDNPNWFKIELVNQGDHPRTITVSNIRAEGVAGPANAVALRVEAPPVAAAPKPGVDGPTPYPDPKNESAWPGKGPIRAFGFMVGERQAFWAKRQQDQGAVVFVGDSLTGGWKNLAKDIPKLKVANRGLGGDTSRGALFRFKQDVLDLNPKAVVIEIGNNDLTAMGAPADMLSNLAAMVALAEKEKPGMPVVLCSIPPSANPKAPVKPESRQAMNTGIRQLAAEHATAHFGDLSTALANADGSPKLEYFAADKLHMNDAGHIKWAELLTPIFEKLKLE